MPSPFGGREQHSKRTTCQAQTGRCGNDWRLLEMGGGCLQSLRGSHPKMNESDGQIWHIYTCHATWIYQHRYPATKTSPFWPKDQDPLRQGRYKWLTLTWEFSSCDKRKWPCDKVAIYPRRDLSVAATEDECLVLSRAVVVLQGTLQPSLPTIKNQWNISF